MGAFSEYLRNKLVGHGTGRASYTAPTPYVALYDGDPAGAGAELETPGENGYQRQTVTMTEESGGASTNAAAITWGPATAAWGTVAYLVAFDAPTGGNVLWSDDVTPKTIGELDSYQIPAGSLSLGLT